MTIANGVDCNAMENGDVLKITFEYKVYTVSRVYKSNNCIDTNIWIQSFWWVLSHTSLTKTRRFFSKIYKVFFASAKSLESMPFHLWKNKLFKYMYQDLADYKYVLVSFACEKIKTVANILANITLVYALYYQ